MSQSDRKQGTPNGTGLIKSPRKRGNGSWEKKKEREGTKEKMNNTSTTLYMQGLDPLMRERDISKMIYNGIQLTPSAVKIIFDKETRESKCYCFISFETQHEMDQAKEYLAYKGYKIGSAHSMPTHNDNDASVSRPNYNSVIRTFQLGYKIGGGSEINKEFLKYLALQFRLQLFKIQASYSMYKHYLNNITLSNDPRSPQRQASGKRREAASLEPLKASKYELLAHMHGVYDVLHFLTQKEDMNPFEHFHANWLLQDMQSTTAQITLAHLANCLAYYKQALLKLHEGNLWEEQLLSKALADRTWHVAYGKVPFPLYVTSTYGRPATGRDKVEGVLPLIIIPLETSYIQSQKTLLPHQISPPSPVYYSQSPIKDEYFTFDFDS